MKPLSALLCVCLVACGDTHSGSTDGAIPDADPAVGQWQEFAMPGPFGFSRIVKDITIAPDGTVYMAGVFIDAACRMA